MGKPRDAAKERFWRALIRRQAAGGLGIRSFCRQEHVPEHRFQRWRRTLRERDRERAAAPRQRVSSQPSVSPFLPVHLPLSLGTTIEVVHPRGHILRVPSVFDALALQRILAILDAPAESSGGLR